MVNSASFTASMIKEFAKGVLSSSMPTDYMVGKVTSDEPLKIELDNKLELDEKQLILTSLVQNFDVDMYMEHETEETDLTHKHDATTTVIGVAGPYPFTDSGTKTTIQNSPDSDKHTHEYKGVKTFTVNLKLKKDELVILLRVQGGQKFIVLDRLRKLNDTKYNNKFE